jgi:hypothetical protein
MAKGWVPTGTKTQARVIGVMQDTDAQILNALKGAQKEVKSIIAQVATSPGIGSAVRTAQIQAAGEAAGQVMTQFFTDDVATAVTAGMRQTASLAALQQEAILSVLGKGAAGTVLGESLRASAQLAYLNLQSRIVNSIPLSSMVYKNGVVAAGTIDDIVNNGLLLGQSAREIADAVLAYVDPLTPGGARYAANRLGRTELHNAFHETSRESYKQQPWVEGVQWNISGSHPLDDECDEFSSQDDFDLGPGVFPKDEVPDVPHPQCLCYITAVTPDPDQFVDNLNNGLYGCG